MRELNRDLSRGIISPVETLGRLVLSFRQDHAMRIMPDSLAGGDTFEEPVLP